MPSYFRSAKPGPLRRVVERFGPDAVAIIEHYEAEVWRDALRKNPRIVALTTLKVGGKGVPWPWGTPAGQRRDKPTAGGRTMPKLYLQSVDRYRAQGLLDDPAAQWEIYQAPTGPGRSAPYVRRVA